MLNQDIEYMLLGAWANGEHREDITQFDKRVFYNEDVFTDLKEGLNAVQLGAKSENYNLNVAALLYEYEPYSYYGAKGIALKEQLNLYIQDLQKAPIDEYDAITEKITQTRNYINETDLIKKSSKFSENFLEELDRRFTERSPHYGLKQIDNNTGGLHRGQLVVLSARPGVGKSALALQITNNVIREGYKVLYLPLEMTAYETFQRMIIQEQIVGNSEEAKNPTELQRKQIKEFLDRLEEEGLFSMYEGLNSLEAIEKKIKEERPYLVVVDQLTQVNPGGKIKDIRDKYIKVTNTLKRIALNENICILALSQLNRESTNRSRPGIENLAESDSTGRDADVVLMLKADEEEDYKLLKRIDVIIAKNRQGRAGDKETYQFSGNKYTFFPCTPNYLEMDSKPHKVI